MKKYLLPVIIAMCSCTSEHAEVQTIEEDAKIVKVSFAEMNDGDLNSRIIYDLNNKFWWKSGDVLGIFPMNIETKEGKGSQLEFPINLVEGQKAESAKFEGGGWAFKGGYSYAAYCPYELMNTRGNKIEFSYTEQQRKVDEDGFDVTKNTLWIAPPSTVSNGAISFEFFPAEAFLRIELYGLPADKSYKSLTLYAESEVIPQKKEYDIFSMELEGKTFSISDKVLSVSNNLKIDLMNATLDNDNKILVWMAMPAIGDAYGSFKAVVKDSEGNLYIGKLLAKDSTPFVKSITRNSRTTVRVNEFDLVDGFQGGIEDWVNDGQDYGGIAN
jgi:hypothetical protein